MSVRMLRRNAEMRVKAPRFKRLTTRKDAVAPGGCRVARARAFLNLIRTSLAAVEA